MFAKEVLSPAQLKEHEKPPHLAVIKRGPYTLTKANSKNAATVNRQKYPLNVKSLPRIKSRSHLEIYEQRDLYRQHRDRLAHIKGKVNTHLPPPKVKPIEVKGMQLSYMEMLTTLYRKSNNTLRTFTKSPDRLAAGRWKNTSLARETERKQQEKNKNLHLGGQLFDPQLGKSRRNKLKVPKAFSYEVPMHVLHRYENLMNIYDAHVLCKLLRPQIFMDLEVTGTRIQGRLEIQLFTEACPQVVLEFMRICTQQSEQSIYFTRVFAPVWLEGCISCDPNRNLGVNNIEHDFEVLNHGVDAGILSFPSRYVRGNTRSDLTFTISFKPLSILNGKRIAFGKVRKGLQLLERIQDATGHLTKKKLVMLTKCGVL